MPRPPKPVAPDAVYTLNVRMPGWLQNEILVAAEGCGVGLAEWVVLQCWVALREGKGLPVAPVGRPLPSVVDEVRAWVVGERVLMPCGVSECGFVEVCVGGQCFCDVCGVRVV